MITTKYNTVPLIGSATEIKDTVYYADVLSCWYVVIQEKGVVVQTWFLTLPPLQNSKTVAEDTDIDKDFYLKILAVATKQANEVFK